MTPGSTALGVVSIVIVALAACFLLFGCVHVAYEPGLPLPERPELRFFRCGPENVWVCLTEADANAWLRYTLKLNEFEAARARLLEK